MDNIEFLKVSAKLPGYLFVLANLTMPGDSVLLGTNDEHIQTQMNLIGLEPRSSPDNQFQTAHMISKEMQNAGGTWIFELGNTAMVVQFRETISLEQFTSFSNKLIAQHLGAILVEELSNTVEAKSFMVALSRESSFYTSLKKKILRFGLVK